MVLKFEVRDTKYGILLLLNAERRLKTVDILPMEFRISYFLLCTCLPAGRQVSWLLYLVSKGSCDLILLMRLQPIRPHADFHFDRHRKGNGIGHQAWNFFFE